jgi:hypothetical protein
MRIILSRWLLCALLIGWAVSHAAVFGQDKAVSTVDKMRQGLDKVITVDYAGETLTEVLRHLQEKTGVPINLDQFVITNADTNINVPVGADPVQIKVKATNEKASQVLRKLLNVHYLSYVILDDGVFVSYDELAIARQYLQRVSVAVEDVPFKKAVRDLAKKHGINLMIDPKMMKQAETPVSVELDNASLETAIRILAEMANLKTARMGNVMFITSDERAKKIREEEQHQFDNPLNPPLGGAVSGRAGMPVGVGAAPPAIRVAPNALPAPRAPAGEPLPAPPPIPVPGGIRPQPAAAPQPVGP